MVNQKPFVRGVPSMTKLHFGQIKHGFDSIFDRETKRGLWSSFKIMFIGIGGVILSQTTGDITLGEQTMPSFVWIYLAIAFQAGIIVRHIGMFKT